MATSCPTRFNQLEHGKLILLASPSIVISRLKLTVRIVSKKGGVSIPVFECLFNGSESITSFTRSFDQALYEHLPNLYVVCISKNKGKQRNLVGGFFIKTSYSHEDGDDFQEALERALYTSENLAKFTGPQFSLLPARLGVRGSEPLSEAEMLKTFSTQYLKFSTAGSA